MHKLIRLPFNKQRRLTKSINANTSILFLVDSTASFQTNFLITNKNEIWNIIFI